jgi:hypothetical protein
MSTNPYTSPYPTSATRKELDLRDEMERLLYGASDEIAKGREGLLRRMRRDNNGFLKQCPCRGRDNNEPDRDFYCPYCIGMGYFWDEVKIVYYRNDDSFRKIEGKNREFEGDVFYFEYDTVITPDDYIITVKLDLDGDPITPVERDVYFKILSVDPFRSDTGRVEFLAVRAKEERKWSTHYGVKNRQYT